MSRGEKQSSAFTSNGHEAYPPTYSDSKRRDEFSTWTLFAIADRILWYQGFLSDKKIWKSPRTLGEVALNLRHLHFENEYSKGPESFAEWIRDQVVSRELETNEALNIDDCPTTPIDTNKLREMLSDEQS